MKNTRAMIISLAFLSPLSVVLILIVWNLNLTSASLTSFSFGGLIYGAAILSSVATFGLLAPGCTFVLCLIMDCILAIRAAVRSGRSSNETTIQKK